MPHAPGISCEPHSNTNLDLDVVGRLARRSLHRTVLAHSYRSLQPRYIGKVRGVSGDPVVGPWGFEMFGWLRRQDDGARRAYEMGRQAAEQFASDLESFMDARFKPVSEGYLGVVQKQFNKCMSPTDGPPIVVARIEYGIFL